MSPTRLVLVRHGQTDWNLTARFQGQADVGLNDTGVQQAQRAAPHVAAFGPTAVLSSPLQRASLTAQYIADACGIDVVQTDPRLEEINVGTWAGESLTDIRQQHPWMDEALRQGRDFRRSDTGETGAELAERVGASLRDIADAFAGQTVAVVSHGMALRYGMLAVLGWDSSIAVGLAGLYNASWSVIEHRELWKLVTYNNVAPEADNPTLPSLSSP